MGFTKINNTDLVDIGVIGLPDTPGLSTGAMQAKLEETGRSVIIPKHNALIDELEASTAADYLGATPITGRTSSPTVQAVMQKLSDDLGVVEAGMASAIAHDHTHSNLSLLETYTQTESDLADAVSKKHAHSNLSLLETYTQTETDLADAVSKKHAHSNLSLLETYTQTETDLADAVSKKHAHSNKALLDTYAQTETDLADAVSKKHAHSNKALLDTYAQTETDLADAVSKKHSHSNKTVIDALSDNGGTLEYNGSPVGGGSVNDAYKSIVSAGTTFTASGEDTFKISAGSNVTITALSSPDKGIQISATGGGSSTGDMLMADYDSSGNVKTAGGIDAYVTAEIGKLDVSDSAVSGQYVSSVSETDGKISVSRTSLPTIPTVVNTYSSTGTDAISGTGVNAALQTLDVSDSAVSGQYVSAVSETDGKISVSRASLPTIPTVNSSALTIQKGSSNSYYYANANGAATVGLDYYLTSVTQLNGKATFDNLNPNYGYDLYYDDDGATGSVTVPTWAGTYTKTTGTDPGTIKLEYDINGGVNGTSKWTLRVLK